MTPLYFSLSIVLMFGVLLAYELSADATRSQIKPFGLFSWITTGNWPAKVGAGMLLLGIGALPRYAALHSQLPPALKLAGGLVIAFTLGTMSFLLKRHPQHKALHLAIAGAAFGVAYLTAYSAYGIFNYINDINALSLLALVAAAAGVFAISSNAMSVGVLAMAGAYIAPAFALGKPGPLAVYGYYLAISAMSLVMVSMRGWRALIHLSFLFTLGGALFFGWSAKFFLPQHFPVMQPLILALAVVHLIMPLVERRHASTTWLVRFDLAYFIALPLAAAAAILMIAQEIATKGSAGLILLAAIWGAAAGVLKILKRDQVLRHGFIAILLGMGAILCRLHDIPWSLLALGCMVATLAAAPRLGLSRPMEEFLCGAALLIALLHHLYLGQELMVEVLQQPQFLNNYFGQRIAASAMLGLCAWIAHTRKMGFSKVLGITAALLATLTLAPELRRFHIDLAQLAYGLLIAAIAMTAFVRHSKTPSRISIGLIMCALPVCGWWAAQDAPAPYLYTFLVLTPLCLFAMALPRRRGPARDDFGPVCALAVLPIALLPFANAAAHAFDIETNFFEATLVMASALLASLAARIWMPSSCRWNDMVLPWYFVLTVLALAAIELFHIERGVWPIAFELLALAYLASATLLLTQAGSSHRIICVTLIILLGALVFQAMLLRALGPEGVMNALDLLHMKLRGVASLMWAGIGAGLAWWGTKAGSRAIWSTGATVLVLVAAKLVLLDFGSLGQLNYILAMIASGMIFLGVAWLAPIPPKVVLAPDNRQRVNRRAVGSQPSSRPAQPGPALEPLATRASATEPHVSRPQSEKTTVPKTESRLWILFLILALIPIIALPAFAWRHHVHHKRAFLRESAISTPAAKTAAKDAEMEAGTITQRRGRQHANFVATAHEQGRPRQAPQQPQPAHPPHRL